MVFTHSLLPSNRLFQVYLTQLPQQSVSCYKCLLQQSPSESQLVENQVFTYLMEAVSGIDYQKLTTFLESK